MHEHYNHQPDRPAWTCREDGEPWPCSMARQRLLDLYRNNRQALSQLLGWRFVQAMDDGLDMTGSGMLQRWFLWLPKPGQKQLHDTLWRQ